MFDYLEDETQRTLPLLALDCGYVLSFLVRITIRSWRWASVADRSAINRIELWRRMWRGALGMERSVDVCGSGVDHTAIQLDMTAFSAPRRRRRRTRRPTDETDDSEHASADSSDDESSESLAWRHAPDKTAKR